MLPVSVIKYNSHLLFKVLHDFSMNSKSKLSYKNRFAKLVLTFQKSCNYLYSKTSKVQPLYTTPHLTAPNTDYRLKKRRRLFPCWATGERSRANTDYGRIMSNFSKFYTTKIYTPNYSIVKDSNADLTVETETPKSAHNH